MANPKKRHQQHDSGNSPLRINGARPPIFSVLATEQSAAVHLTTYHQRVSGK